ncbi:hypothetical protein TS70_00905 [Spiroplasma sp. hyd1]|nr:hypothetical protein [Spiroplasma sp. hyd1]
MKKTKKIDKQMFIYFYDNNFYKNDKITIYKVWSKNRLLALLVKKLQIFVKKILIEKYNFN